MVKVGVGISTFNGATRVDELLASLEKHTKQIGYEVFVLDDGGPKNNFESLTEVCGNYGVEVACHEKNKGISATWNTLTKHFDSEFVVLLNDDLVLVPQWLENLVYFAENNKFATAGLPMYAPKKSGKPELGWKKTKHGWKPFLAFPKKKPLRCPCAPGPCFIFKRSLFDFVGGFDEHYWSFYEEVDFSLSLARYGYSSYILPDPWIYHYWARTFAENQQLAANERMDFSRAFFMQKWGGRLEGVYPFINQNISLQKLKWIYKGAQKIGVEDPFSYHAEIHPVDTPFGDVKK